MAQAKTRTGRAGNTSLVLAKGAAPAVRGSNGSPRAEVAGDAGTDPTPATMTTSIKGKITITVDNKKYQMPVSASLPPPQEGAKGYVFDLVNDPATATKIPAGEFIDWAVKQLGGSSITLPESLTGFTVAVSKLRFDTKGDFDIEVQIGSQKQGEEWKPTWKPISNLPLTLDDVEMKFKKGEVPAQPAA